MAGRKTKTISEDKLKKFADWVKTVGDRQLNRGELKDIAKGIGIAPPIAVEMAKKADLKLPKNKDRKAKGHGKEVKDNAGKNATFQNSGIVHAKGMAIIPEKEYKVIVKTIGRLSDELDGLKKTLGIE